MDRSSCRLLPLLLVLMILITARSAMADLNQDEKECGEKLGKVQPCFPYVQGKQKKPSQDCCSDLKTVRMSDPKCLCILVRDSTSPVLGFSVNQTLLLSLPTVCNVEANITQCPILLGLAPNSPDAKIFQPGGSSPQAGSSTATKPSAAAPTIKTMGFAPALVLGVMFVCLLVPVFAVSLPS